MSYQAHPSEMDGGHKSRRVHLVLYMHRSTCQGSLMIFLFPDELKRYQL